MQQYINYLTEMCSGSEVGLYLRLTDFVYHSALGLRIIKKKERKECTSSGVFCDGLLSQPDARRREEEPHRERREQPNEEKLWRATKHQFPEQRNISFWNNETSVFRNNKASVFGSTKRQFPEEEPHRKCRQQARQKKLPDRMKDPLSRRGEKTFIEKKNCGVQRNIKFRKGTRAGRRGGTAVPRSARIQGSLTFALGSRVI